MQAKRFIVPNMREGLKTIKDVLGDDAVIISNTQTQEGMEIIAGIPDEPEYQSLQGSASVLLNAQTKQKQDMLLDVYKEQTIDKPLAEGKPLTKIDPPKATQEYSVEEVYPQKSVLNTLNHELNSIRQVLSSQINDIAWKQFGLENPYQAKMADTLMQAGFSKMMSCQFASRVEHDNDLKMMTQKALHLISDQILYQIDDIDWEKGKKVFVGPGGCGKTKSIGKLLPHLLKQYDAEDIAIVSYSEHRLGQFDESLVFGNIFQVSATIVADIADLDAALNRMEDKKVVLIDLNTPSQHEFVDAYGALNRLPFEFEPIGVLAANADYQSMHRWAKHFKTLQVSHVLTTKLDECVIKGPVFDIMLTHGFSVQSLFDTPQMTQPFEPVDKKQLMNLLRDIYESIQAQ